MVMAVFMGTAYLLKLLSLITGLSVLKMVRSWDIHVPETVTAVEGSCVVVPCQTQPHIRVIWYQYHKRNYPVVFDKILPSVEQRFRGRTSVPGKAEEGNCTLLIRNVRRADNNLQVYVWINPDSRATQKFYDQTVTIYVEKKAPIISIQTHIEAGKVFQANCSIIHSCPSSTPSLRWTTSPLLINSTLTANNEKDNSFWMYKETLQSLATYEMHKSQIICSAMFSDFTVDSQPTTLHVLYKPVTVKLQVENESVIEGGSVLMKCTANSNPQPHTYSWLRRQRGLSTKTNTTEGTRLFNNIARETSFSCIAHNDIGAQQSVWMDLDVLYSPIILPESSCHLTLEALKCVCRVKSSPNASIHWSIDGNDTLSPPFSLVYTTKTYEITGEMSWPTQSQVNVTCTASNSLGNDTRILHQDILQKSFFVTMWWVAPVLLGIALVLGFAVLIYKKCFQHRSSQGYTCDTTVSFRPMTLAEHIEEEQRYNSPQRVQVSDNGPQFNASQPGSDPEGDRLSCVYDNDTVEEVRKAKAEQRQNKTTTPQGEREEETLGKNEPSYMKDYQNC